MLIPIYDDTLDINTVNFLLKQCGYGKLMTEHFTRCFTIYAPNAADELQSEPIWPTLP